MHVRANPFSCFSILQRPVLSSLTEAEGEHFSFPVKTHTRHLTHLSRPHVWVLALDMFIQSFSIPASIIFKVTEVEWGLGDGVFPSCHDAKGGTLPGQVMGESQDQM